MQAHHTKYMTIWLKFSWMCLYRAGFVFFYDLVMGVEDPLKSMRLLAGLYFNEQKLGQTNATLQEHYCPRVLETMQYWLLSNLCQVSLFRDKYGHTDTRLRYWSCFISEYSHLQISLWSKRSRLLKVWICLTMKLRAWGLWARLSLISLISTTRLTVVPGGFPSALLIVKFYKALDKLTALNLSCLGDLRHNPGKPRM